MKNRFRPVASTGTPRPVQGRPGCSLLSALGASLALLSPVAHAGVTWSYQLLAEGTHVSLPAIDNGTVAFINQLGQAQTPSSSGQSRTLAEGVYTWSAATGVQTVALSTDSVPGLNGNFSFTQSVAPSLSNGAVAFYAQNLVAGQVAGSGIYSNMWGALQSEADTTITSQPGTSPLFSDFAHAPSITMRTIVPFVGFQAAQGGSTNEGVFVGLGGLVDKVAGTSTPIPNAPGYNLGNFQFFGLYPSLDDRASGAPVIAFQASKDLPSQAFYGVYVTNGTTLIPVADGLTQIPGGNGETFRYVASPAINNGVLAFYGQGTNRAGIYTATPGGAVVRVADTETIAASVGGSAQFECPVSVGAPAIFPSIDHGAVAFVACGDASTGLFATVGDALSEVVDLGSLSDFLGAGTVALELNIFHEGLSGNQVAFWAQTNKGEVIVLATAAIPEPATALLAVLGLGLLPGWRSAGTRPR